MQEEEHAAKSNGSTSEKKGRSAVEYESLERKVDRFLKHTCAMSEYVLRNP